jgi:hypothetical protein
MRAHDLLQVRIYTARSNVSERNDTKNLENETILSPIPARQTRSNNKTIIFVVQTYKRAAWPSKQMSDFKKHRLSDQDSAMSNDS